MLTALEGPLAAKRKSMPVPRRAMKEGKLMRVELRNATSKSTKARRDTTPQTSMDRRRVEPSRSETAAPARVPHTEEAAVRAPNRRSTHSGPRLKSCRAAFGPQNASAPTLAVHMTPPRVLRRNTGNLHRWTKCAMALYTRCHGPPEAAGVCTGSPSLWVFSERRSTGCAKRVKPTKGIIRRASNTNTPRQPMAGPRIPPIIYPRA
mmetsp:Transcript_33841/g.95809  ORF Transcript_33841/g.95809 Transcript_33841/m.95809 type:complete len:206 (-) Transcript_33841:775-1392(-)